MAHTKCFDLPCSVTIRYSNTKNFDGILYEQTPKPVFEIVIPGKFQVSDNPQEQEDSELSNGEIVMLRQSIQQKKLLEIGYLPDHKHLGIQKILMHDSIEIDGKFWRRKDPYETEPVDDYGLKTASVWLTLYNSIEKNTL